MSKATPPTDDSRNARQTDAPSTTITVNNKYDQNLPARSRHAAREIVEELSETYDYEYTATVVPTASGFRIKIPSGRAVGTAVVHNATPHGWGVGMLVHHTGKIVIEVTPHY